MSKADLLKEKARLKSASEKKRAAKKRAFCLPLGRLDHKHETTYSAGRFLGGPSVC